MKFQNVFRRYEIKYLISRQQRRLIENAMSEYMRPDKYGRSAICSIYYDTPDKRLIRRSIEKPVYKEKLRLRSYGIAAADSMVFVELKKKYQQVVYKRRAAMPCGEAEKYLTGNNLPDHPTQITREIDYFKSVYPKIAPSVFISCQRAAFYAKDDPNFRMTFDESILWRDTDLSLKSGIYGEPLLGRDEVLLEVKSALALPLWLAHVLNQNGIYKTSFSKYGNAYKAMLGMKNTGGARSA